MLQGPLFAGRCCIVAFSSNTAQLSEGRSPAKPHGTSESFPFAGFSGIILEGGAVAVRRLTPAGSLLLSCRFRGSPHQPDGISATTEMRSC